MDRNLQVGLAVVILLFAAYVGGYYGMVFRAYGIGGVGWMTWSAGYRIEALRGIFEPMHHLDRKLRRSYWHQDFPEERLLDIKLACRDFE